MQEKNFFFIFFIYIGKLNQPTA